MTELGDKRLQLGQELAEQRRLARIAERKKKRTFAICFTAAAGSIEAKKALVETDPRYEAACEAWEQAEYNMEIKKAAIDALEIQFEEWRTKESTKRAEMRML